MRFGSVLLATGVISTVNAQFIIGAIAAVELVVEFWEAAEVVATVDAAVDIGITAEEVTAEEFEFHATETASAGRFRARGAGPRPAQVARSVHGELDLPNVPPGASRHVGQVSVEIEGLIVNDNTITPSLRVDMDWAADVVLSRSHPGGGARFIMNNLDVSGARFGFLESTGLSAHIIRVGGRLLSTR